MFDNGDVDATTLLASLMSDIESAGNASLFKSDGVYNVQAAGGPPAVAIRVMGTAATEGQFGAWTPLGAEQAAGGFQVVWKNGSADQYTIWNLDGGGNYVTSGAVLSGASQALQSAEALFQQNFNGDGTTGITTTVIEASGSTDLVQVADTYHLGSPSGPQIGIGGTPITAGQLGNWTPIAAEQAGAGYQVVFKNGSVDQYTIWTVDNAGNYVTSGAVLSGASAGLQSAETAFVQDLNADGTTGIATTEIETSGSTDLVQVADKYHLGGPLGPQIAIGGTPITAGQLGAWAPIAAEAVAGGYQVAFKNGSADQYTIWTVDNAGNYVTSGAVLSGSSAALQSAETQFQQDLNDDDTTGITTTEIETSGSTDLVQVADKYHLGGPSGPQIGIGGTPITAGQLGAWTPIAAEAVTGGYQVVFKNGSADQYTIWTVNGAGNYVGSSAVVSGASSALQSAEIEFQQNLNGDGTTGPATTAIDTSGATSLVQIADKYFLGGPSGPPLSLQGTPITAGQLGAWTPIAAEAVVGGYQVVFKNGGTDQYTIWTVNSAGNYVTSGATMSGSALGTGYVEYQFRQDLNGDNQQPAVTVVETQGTTRLEKVGNTYFLNPAAGGPLGPQLKMGGTVVEAGAWEAIAAEANGGGYRVAWKLAGAEQYKIWTADGGGNFLAGDSVLLGGTSGFQIQEPGFGQDLNQDGAVGLKTTIVESSGATVFKQVADLYFIGDAGPQLMYQGGAVTSGQFSGWTAIGAEANGSGGYLVAWKHGGTSEFKIWNVDGNGNYLAGDVVLSGLASALQSKESTLLQDLNSDGTIGIKTTVIESSGATTLTQIADTFTVDGKTVMLNGAAFVVGQVDAWTPIGAEATAGGYQLAMKFGATDQYAVWGLDSNGDYRSGSSSGVMNGNALGAEYYEYVFQQDLNQDTLAPTLTVIESTGLTTLVKVGSGYFLNPSSGGRGPQLHVDGIVFSAGGQPGTWVPVAAEEWAEGFDIWNIAFKRVGSDSFREETARDGGDMAPFFGLGGTYSASSPEVEDIESNVHQDINGDGVVGSTSVMVESSGSSSLYRSTITNTYHLGARDGVELKINGVAVTGDDLWKPIAIEVGSNGPYQVTLKAGNLDQYQVGRTDGAGNFIASSLGILSASSIELKIWETLFQQNLNGDGVIGIPDGVIEDNGSAKLVKENGGFYAYQTGSATGVLLKTANGGPLVNNSVLANTFVPIGVDWTSEYGFQVVSLFTDTNAYKVDDADSTGKFTIQTIGTLTSDSMLLKAAEGIFQQDFNRDGTTGLPSSGAFDVDIHFHGDQGYRLYFEAAAQRWEQIITADLPDTVSVTPDYGTIDDVRIDVTVDDIDGRNGILASADWDELGNGWLPTHGNISIDSGDLSFMRSDNRLLSVVIHEIGHVLGIGTLWSAFGLKDSNGYVGEYGLEAYRQLSGNASATFVPLETAGGDGTAGVHWSDSVFGNELMTGYISGSVNPLSILTIGALKDLGYAVDYSKADSYTMPAA